MVIFVGMTLHGGFLKVLEYPLKIKILLVHDVAI